MSTKRFLKAAAGGAVLILSIALLAAAPMHNSFPISFSENKIALAPRSGSSPPQEKSSPADAESLFHSANPERASQGLPALQWDDALAAAARKHASLMAKEDELSHQLARELALDKRVAQAGARFSMVGENVGIGTDVPGIHDGWMHSPGHRAN